VKETREGEREREGRKEGGKERERETIVSIYKCVYVLLV
jgi:hypothetical protein